MEIRLSQAQHYRYFGLDNSLSGSSVMSIDSSTPAIFPLDTRSLPLPVMTIKTYLQTLPNVPCGTKSSLVENYLFKSTCPMSSNASKFSNQFLSMSSEYLYLSRLQLLNNSREHLETITDSLIWKGPQEKRESEEP